MFTPRIEELVLGRGGEEPGGGEQASRPGSQSSRTADWDNTPGLLGKQTGIPLAPGLLDRGKDYASQLNAPGKQGPADY